MIFMPTHGGEARMQERKSKVRGQWIPYDSKSINGFLGNLFPNQDEQYNYQRLKFTHVDSVTIG